MKRQTTHRVPIPGHPAWPNLPCCNRSRDAYGLGHGFTGDPAKVTCRGSK